MANLIESKAAVPRAVNDSSPASDNAVQAATCVRDVGRSDAPVYSSCSGILSSAQSWGPARQGLKAIVEAGDQTQSVVVAFAVANPRLCLARSRCLHTRLLDSNSHFVYRASVCQLLGADYAHWKVGYCCIARPCYIISFCPATLIRMDVEEFAIRTHPI